MKRILLLLFVCVLSGCTPSIYYTETARVIDYFNSSKQGIFITEASSVNFEYEALGNISITLKSGFTNEKL